MRSTLPALTSLLILVGACTASADEPGGVGQEAADSIAPESTESTTTASVVGSGEVQTTAPEVVSTSKVEASLETDPFIVNQGLARTLNIGAVYEVAKGETWANDFAPEDLDEIAAQGFTAVRIPIKWSDWTAPVPILTIDPEIFEQIDAVVDRALLNDLSVVIDVHHFEELDANPEAEAERFLAIWFQIAEHYQDMPLSVVFEVSNEPHDQFSGPVLNALLDHVVPIIRQSNPDRTIMIGPDQWYSPLQLDDLVLPDDDNLIVTVHYYEPFPFTHQGASWVEGSDAWVGTGFSDPEDRELIEAEFALVAEWADQNNVPIFVGEFGALDGAEREDRLAWTLFVREQSERYEFSWAYWDWATPGFGVYSHASGKWDIEMLDALLDS